MPPGGALRAYSAVPTAFSGRQVDLTNAPMHRKILNVSKVSSMTTSATPSDREKVASKLPGWLRQNLKIRTAQLGIEIQNAVEQGIAAWCDLASTNTRAP